MGGLMEKLIRKKDALDALMAERKHLLANGQKGAEHVLTHRGYNVIDELQPVQSDVPDIYAGELISRQAATTIPVMPKEHRCYQTNNLDDAYEQGWNDLQECIENLPTVQPKHGKWIPVINGRGGHECDQCHNYAPSYQNGKEHLSDFCPNCGADMRTKEADCDYERAVEQLEHDMLYEPTFNPDDGSM